MPVPLSSYKTPGVYVQEIQKLPPSIAQVETAIPVFIGYTQKAMRETEKDLQNVPTKVRSLGEYVNLFGTTKPEELEISINLVSGTGRRVFQVDNASDPTYHMYYALQMFYANGGGECFIISVGDMTDPISKASMESAILLLKEYTEPSLLLFPDAVEGLPTDEYLSLMQAALLHCADPKINNCFTMMDVPQHNGRQANVDADAEAFRNGLSGSIEEMKYGATYYPYLETTIPLVRSLDHITIVRSTIDGETAPQVEERLKKLDANTPDTDPNKQKIQKELAAAIARREAEGKSKIALKKVTDAQASLDHLNIKKEIKGDVTRALEKAIIDGKDSTTVLQLGLAAIPDIFTNLRKDLTESVDVTGTPAQVKKAIEDEVENALAKIDEDIERAQDNLDKAKAAALPVFQESAKAGAQTYATLDAVGEIDNGLLNEILRALDTKGRIILPPSSAMAGIYARVDNAQGVHKAPANVGVSSISGTHRAISDEVQDGLNVDTLGGKSINVIRTFKGIGTLVWGARTLAGNDREWKYISVRRFFNMVEESVKRALFRFVFEPNNPNTWTSVRASIEAFLETQWRAGALLGNTPNDAFFVRVGMPETFSEAEMLDGYMVVEIGMAVVRPAEFIVLKFMHHFELAQ